MCARMITANAIKASRRRFREEAFAAVRDTRGKVLVWNDEICDARYSKSCGGMTEVFRAAWEDREVCRILLRSMTGAGEISELPMPLTDEANAVAWIQFVASRLLQYDLGGVAGANTAGIRSGDARFLSLESQSTRRTNCARSSRARLGIDVGRILALEPVERGESGRIIKLRIKGENANLVIGKELEIRRALSRSHLYSSAFVVKQSKRSSGYPQSFTLIGAGWGHGVGLCQIGAAVMADEGHSHEAILTHYFRGAIARLALLICCC